VIFHFPLTHTARSNSVEVERRIIAYSSVPESDEKSFEGTDLSYLGRNPPQRFQKRTRQTRGIG